MNVAIILASVFIVCISGQDDPTKICQPNAYQSGVYNPTSDDAGVFAIDYTQGVLAVQYRRTVHVIYNLTDGTGVSVNNTDGSCTQLPANPAISRLVEQCLPASAVRLGNVSTIGLNPGGVQIQAYEIDDGVIVSRVALTTTPPIVPILREVRVGPTVSQVLFFSNQAATVTAPGIFTQPAACGSRS